VECTRRRWQRNLSLVQLAWDTSEPVVPGASIIGATSMAQLKEDIVAAQITLDAETLEEIRRIQLRYPNPAG
jgi:aryl-alcohol dehydrogenase-like predicted oxidoreductase